MKKSAIIILSLVFTILTSFNFMFAQTIRNGGHNITYTPEGNIYRENIQRFLVKSDYLFRQGAHLEALNQLDLAVEESPQNPEAYLHRAMLRYRLGMRTEANQDLALVAKMNPVAVDLFGFNGPKAQLDLLAFYPEDLYLHLERDFPLEAYERILNNWQSELYSDHTTEEIPTLEAAAIHLETILDALAQNSWTEAKEELELLVQIKANESVVYDLKGLVELALDNPVLANIYFNKALKLNPNNGLALYNLSKIIQDAEGIEAGIETLNEAILLAPTLSDAYFKRALLYKEIGNLEAAIADYTTVIKLEGDGATSAYFNRALSLKKRGQFSAALTNLDHVLQITTNNANIWKVRGNISLLAGNHSTAISDFSKAIALDSDLAEAYFNRGIAHLLDNNVSPACMDFEKSSTKGYERGEQKQVYFCKN